MENIFKTAENQPKNILAPEKNNNGGGQENIFSALGKDEQGIWIIQNIPFVLFLALIAVFYIWNSHQTEKMIREKNKIERELNELRWEYMTSKNDLMFKSKQTEVMKLVQDSTLQVLTSPPKKIVIKK